MERLTTSLDTKEIGRHPRVAAIAVWKRMDRDKAIVKAHRDLFQWKGKLSKLIVGVVAQRLNRHGYFCPWDPNVLVRLAKLPSPLPRPIEHSQMEPLQTVAAH